MVGVTKYWREQDDNNDNTGCIVHYFLVATASNISVIVVSAISRVITTSLHNIFTNCSLIASQLPAIIVLLAFLKEHQVQKRNNGLTLLGPPDLLLLCRWYRVKVKRVQEALND